MKSKIEKIKGDNVLIGGKWYRIAEKAKRFISYELIGKTAEITIKNEELTYIKTEYNNHIKEVNPQQLGMCFNLAFKECLQNNRIRITGQDFQDSKLAKETTDYLKIISKQLYNTFNETVEELLKE